MLFERMVKISEDISRYGAIAVGWLLMVLTLYISTDVLLRKIFAISVQGSDELGGYVLAIICSFGFSWTLCNRAHIRLNFILPKMQAGVRVILNLIAYIILSGFAYAMLWWGGAMLRESYQLNAVAPTPLSTPLVIPQGIWVLGILLFSIHLTLYMLHIIYLILKKDQAKILVNYGATSD